MNLRAIVYASEAVAGLSLEQMDGLVQAASRFNQQAGVTGVLLYDQARFFQYIEGPEDSINIVYGRILAATSHHEIVEIYRGRVSRRLYPDWSIRALPASPADLRSTATSDWHGFVRSPGQAKLSLIFQPYLGTSGAFSLSS